MIIKTSIFKHFKNLMIIKILVNNTKINSNIMLIAIVVNAIINIKFIVYLMMLFLVYKIAYVYDDVIKNKYVNS